MTMLYSFLHPVWQYQQSHVNFLLQQRKRTSNLERIGINISIVLNSTCSTEGFLEYKIRELAKSRHSLVHKFNYDEFSKRLLFNTYTNKVIGELEDRISRTTGINNYDVILSQLSFKKKPQKLCDYEQIEGIQVMFQLRNVLAHGRAVKADKIVSAPDLALGETKDEFFGGYSKAETYLFKKKLISKKFTNKGDLAHLFTNKATNHFISINKKFIRYVSLLIKNEMNINGVSSHVVKETSKIIASKKLNQNK